MCVCVCFADLTHLFFAFKTYHRTVSQSGVKQIAMQISMFHIGQYDNRGGVTFALYSLQTHTCENTPDHYQRHTLISKRTGLLNKGQC